MSPANMLRERLAVTATRFGILLIFGLILIRTAWATDDAFITLRVVDNFVNGYGLVWNTDERVQAYTHPLWMALISLFYFFTREPYYTVLSISGALSIAAVGTVLKLADTAVLVILTGILLTGSKAFVDFSTSGLENPLSHLLVVAFSLAYIRAREQSERQTSHLVAGIAGLVILNRLDLALLVIPAWIDCFWRERSRMSRMLLMLLTLLPPIVWMAFSTFYYGFPLPNTFYAKQSAHIPRTEYLERGVAYVLDLSLHDPLTFATIALGLALAVLGIRRHVLRALGMGGLTYLAYVVWIGGDFMRGRFFSVVFVLSVVLVLVTLAALRPSTSYRGISLVLASVAFGLSLLTMPQPNWLSDYPYPPIGHVSRLEGHPLLWLIQRVNYPRLITLAHITDERASYYNSTGFLARLHASADIKDALWLAQAGERFKLLRTRVTVQGAIGFMGFYAGPDVKIIDRFALADAFLARLPYQGDKEWRIGHVARMPPDGYISSRLYNQNRLSNHKLRQLYEDLRLATQSRLLSWDRLLAVMRLNLYPPEITSQDLMTPPHDLPLSQVNNHLHVVPSRGLLIYTTAYSRTIPQAMLFVGDPNASYKIAFANDWGDPSAERVVDSPALDERNSQVLSARLITTQLTAPSYFNLLKVESSSPSSAFGYLRLFSHSSAPDSARLLEAGITLSAAIGLAPTLLPHAPIVSTLMAGAWYSSSGADALELVLHPLSCYQGMTVQQGSLVVNNQLVQRFTLDELSCQQPIQLNKSLGPSVMRKGWNLLEIHIAQPGSIAVRKLHLRSATHAQ